MQTKSDLRQQMLQRRRQLTAWQVEQASLDLLQQILPLLSPRMTVAVYDALPGEISLAPLIMKAASLQLSLVRPIAWKQTRVMQFEALTSLTPAPIFQALDYELSVEVKWYNLDLVLLPLVAADVYGYRLGQGGGYYDATFCERRTPPLLCGVGYDWQLVAEVPREPWDLQLDYFASETRLLKFK